MALDKMFSSDLQPAITKTKHPEIKCARNKTKNPKTSKIITVFTV